MNHKQHTIRFPGYEGVEDDSFYNTTTIANILKLISAYRVLQPSRAAIVEDPLTHVTYTFGTQGDDDTYFLWMGEPPAPKTEQDCLFMCECQGNRYEIRFTRAPYDLPKIQMLMELVVLNGAMHRSEINVTHPDH